MHFLQPVFLWAFPALLIPLLLHLFNLQRTEKVVFSNTRMLENLVKETSKARNLRHLLLLFLRLLAFAFIILAFAQPVFSDWQSAGKDDFVSVAAYVDNSFSMDLREENGTALDRAIAYAASIPLTFSNKGWFRLNSNAEQQGRSWTSAGGFRDQLQEIQKSSHQKSPATVLRQAYQQMSLRNASERKHLYLISDFQKDFWDIPDASIFDSSVKHYFVPVLHSFTQNIWIDSAWENMSSGNPGKTEIRFRVKSSGLREPQILRVQMYEGNNLQAGRQVEVKPDLVLETSLTIQQKIQQTRSLRLEVEDSSVPWDNRFFLSLKSPEPFRIYRLGDKQNPVLQKLFSSSPAFRYREGSLQNPDYDALEKSNLILLDKPEILSEGLSARLLGLIEKGSAICVLPSSKTSQALTGAGLLPGTLKELRPDSPKSAVEKVVLPEASSSFFRNAFSNQGKNTVLPESRAILDLNGFGFSLLGFESGQVFLSRISREKGSVFVFASDPSALDVNFHRHPLMLASFFRMASSTRELDNNPLFVSKNQNRILLSLDSGFQVGEGQAELRSEGRRVQAGLGMSGKRVFLQTDFKSLQDGFWEVWQNNRKVDLLAVNRDPSESEMRFFTASELKSMLPERPWIQISELQAGEKTEHLKAGLEQGMPLWKWLIASAIILLIAEAVVNRKLALAGRTS